MASIAWIPAVFGVSTLWLYWLSTHLPVLSGDYAEVALKFPSNLEDLGNLAALLKQYKTDHISYVVLLFSSAYIYKQTFAIPGSVFLNLLAGALFGVFYGFPMACFLTTGGATCCYLLSKYCGKSHVLRFFPDKIGLLQQKIEENMQSLFFFCLFLRLFPVTPNWFLNMAAPIVNVPVHIFALSVFIGLMPYNFICVQTGCILSEVKSLDDVFTSWTLIKLFLVAMVALLPGLLLKNYSNKNHNKNNGQKSV